MESRPKILLYEQMHSEGTNLLAKKCDLVYAESFEEEKLIEQASEAAGILIRANGAVCRTIIEASPKLKVVGRHGVGLDAIDLEAAKAHGVRVVYTPVANMESVAEHFVGLALILAKKMRFGDIEMRTGNWQARTELIGTELRDKILGVMGFGRIGQQTARICHGGFNMKVLYHDVIDFPDAEKELNATRVAPESLFAQSDFISINLPLIPSTRHMVNADLIGHMKPTAFLINMARGPIWKEDDVVEALEEKRIMGVGSDVYETEPPPDDHPLFKMDSFAGTPHMSAHTEEAMIRMSLVAKDMIAVLEGREPEFPVKI
jgi:D-3-phosphoglycerate dehydrogenase